jgi:hypothetical protein
MVVAACKFGEELDLVCELQELDWAKCGREWFLELSRLLSDLQVCGDWILWFLEFRLNWYGGDEVVEKYEACG